MLTTHSPLVISDAKDVLCYVLDDGELQERNGLYGLDANQVLLEVMSWSCAVRKIDKGIEPQSLTRLKRADNALRYPFEDEAFLGLLLEDLRRDIVTAGKFRG